MNNNKLISEIAIESMSTGLFILDKNGFADSFNSSALSILGLTNDQVQKNNLLSQNWKPFKENGSHFSDQDSPATVALSTGQPVKNVLMGFTLPNGNERWITLDAIPCLPEQKVVCTFCDVTDLQKFSIDLNHIFRHSRDLICIASTDGTFKRVSPSFKKILGFDESELLTKPFIDFIHPEDLDATAKIVGLLAQGVPLIDFENRYRTRSGAYRKISWVCEPVAKTGLLYAIGRDVTDLKSAEYRNQQILNAINNTAIVAITDARGTITDVNEKFCSVSGYSKEELIGKDHRVVNSGRHPKSFFNDMWTTIKSGKSWTSIIENCNKSGEHYFLQTVISPLKNTDGGIDQFLSIRFDVTEQSKVEQRLKEAQTIAKIGSWHFDFHSGLQTWSEEHYKIFEIQSPQSQEALHQLYRERIHPDDLPELDRVISRALKFGEDFIFNHRVSFENGKRIKFVQGIGKVSKNSHGQPAFISGTCQDITEQKNQQDRIKASFEFNEAILRSAKLSIITSDLNGVITSFNEEAEKLLGYKAEDVIGKMTPAPFHDPEEVVATAKELSAEFNTHVEVGFPTFVYKAKKGGFDDRRWTYIGKNGARIPVRLNVTSLYNSNNELYGFMGIAKDLSEQINLEKKLEAERVKSIRNAKLASLGEMSAGIAHEINNPLAIISGTVGLLSKFIDNPEKLAVKFDTIKKSSDRIARIVNGLRKFSRTDERSNFQKNDLSTLVSEALVLTESKAKRESTLVTFDCQTKSKVLCDEIEIEQVLVNLINNSVDAVKSKTEKWVKLSIFEDSNSVVLRVMDSGNGIEEHIKNKLFEPFFTTKKVGEGTGLGLSITKGILDEHNATIALVDGIQNTCFEIKFPKIETAKTAA